jgi:hypothetical protein
MLVHLQARVDALDAWRAHQSDLLDEHLNNHPDPHDLDPADDLDDSEIDDTAIGGGDLGGHGLDKRPATPAIGGYALIEWVHDTVAAITARPLRGEFAWCPLWWEHPEAVFRFEALHGAWTELAPEPGAALSIWIRDHLDPCQVPGLVEAGFSRFDGVPSEVLSCVQSFVLDGRDQSELAV